MVDKEEYEQLKKEVENLNNIVNSKDKNLYTGTSLTNEVKANLQTVVNRYTFLREGRVIIYSNDICASNTGGLIKSIIIYNNKNGEEKKIAENISYYPTSFNGIGRNCTAFLNVQEGESVELVIYANEDASIKMNELKVTYLD